MLTVSDSQRERVTLVWEGEGEPEWLCQVELGQGEAGKGESELWFKRFKCYRLFLF